jgi:hypothetical protein
MAEHGDSRTITVSQDEQPIQVVAAVFEGQETSNIGGGRADACSGGRQLAIRIGKCPAPGIERYRLAQRRNQLPAQGERVAATGP